MKGLLLGIRNATALLLACVLLGCKSRQEASSNNLGDAGYQLTAADWFRATADDNPVALELFLKGGMEAEGNALVLIGAHAELELGYANKSLLAKRLLHALIPYLLSRP